MDADMNDGGIQFYQTHQQNEEHQMEVAQQQTEREKIVNAAISAYSHVILINVGLDAFHGKDKERSKAVSSMIAEFMSLIDDLVKFTPDERAHINREAGVLTETSMDEFLAWYAARKGGAK